MTHKQRMQAALKNLQTTPLLYDAIASLIASAYEPIREQPKQFAELFAFLYFAAHDNANPSRIRPASVRKLLRELKRELTEVPK